MLKKVLLPLLAAVLVAVSFSGTAHAAEEDPPGAVHTRGEVIAVDTAVGKFRIENRDGEVWTFFVNENTHFRGKAQNLEGLQVGWKVGVRAREDDNEKLLAVLVISGDPEDIIRFRGLVTDVNTAAGKFTVEKPDGEKQTIFVDERTRYGGQISSLEDLQEGWHAAGAAKEENPGKLIAIGLVAGDARELFKTHGTVTAVDPGAGKFEIETNDGRTLRIFVDEKTRYQGQLSSLDEMQVGWKAGVAAREGEDGKLWAVMVIAGTRPEPIRLTGIVKTVNPGADKFQLEKPDGTVLTIYVDKITRYRGQVESFSDLEKGMRAGVGAVEEEDGSLKARLVVAGMPKGDRERPAPDDDVPLEPRPYDTLSFPLDGNL
jgi:hypothetical protein